jgi:adenylosuccinate synthase
MFGIPPGRVFGVMKAFSSCVGAGPYVTEMDESSADRLRKSANEFGSVTGRPRRMGHFDGVASKYGSRIQGTTDLVLTKLDSLRGISPLLVCTHYSCDVMKAGKPVMVTTSNKSVKS